MFHDHSFSTSGIWNSQEFASSFLCLRNRILFFSSLSLYLSFSTFFSDCLIIDQLGWLLFNVQKKAISHGQNENLIHSQDQDKNFDDYGDEIFKVRPNTLCVKKVK